MIYYSRLTFCSIFFLLLLQLLVNVSAADTKASLQIGIKKPAEKCDQKAAKGDNIQVHYTGMLKSDKSVFDSSVTRGQPFKFVLGQGQVIQGWDQGLMGMCVGEKRRLTIPPHLGYGDRGAGAKIPGGATLVFDVELLAIEKPTSAPVPPEMPDFENFGDERDEL